VKLLQAIVSNAGFRELEANAARFDALDRLLAVARDQTADLVMLPGGYLTVKDEGELRGATAVVTPRAVARRVAVALGIDLPDEPHGKGAQTPRLPYYGAVCGRVPGGPWRQMSSSSQNATEVADEDVPAAARVVAVAGCRVGVLICGELFSWRARQSLAQQHLNLALDLGHESMGTGVTRSMESIARNGGVRESVPIGECDWFGDEEFWIAWRLRQV
jgi:hypothetical protein